MELVGVEPTSMLIQICIKWYENHERIIYILYWSFTLIDSIYWYQCMNQEYYIYIINSDLIK